MADPGGYEGGWQASLLGLPDLPGRPIRRSGGGLCPAVLRRTEADGGVSTHPAPAVRCCLHPTAGCSPSVCSSPRAPSCCLHLRSSSATTAACTTAAAWSWPQETGAARLRPCQAREAPGQAASLRRATRSLWILLFRRWWPHHSFPRRRAGWRIFCFLFVLFRHWPPVGSRVRSEDATPSPASPAQLWSQVSVTPHTQTPLRDALPFESGPCAPFRCPTVGTSVTPLVPLARSLGAWLELPRPSRWLLRTIRLGYAIQFARRPPKFRGIRFTSVLSKDAPVLRAEVAVLLAKDAIEPVPPAEMKSGFYSPYFIVPKKGGGLRPILDLRVLNRALHKLPFRMLTQRRIFQCVRPLDWFAAIDLKDAYFHVSILPRHRPFLRFAFEGRAYQYKALPFGLSLSPRVFTKVVEAALVPLREAGIRILNYLDDWLILAQSRVLLCEHRDMVLSHLSRLGLQVNREKSKLSPMQRISFLGMELDSVNLTARLSEERAQSMLRCLESLQHKRAVPLKHFQRLLGHMASSAAITPLGLLHMRPLQRWLHDRVPRWAWRHGTYRVSLTPSCRRTFSPWSDLAFLRAGVPLEQVSRHVVVSTDASATGWGAMCNGHAAAGLWTGPQLQWHINCLELLAVWLALRRFRTLLHEKHILVRSDNTATVAYINHQGGLRSRRMSQLARHLLLWSQKHLRSLRAVHVPGELNRAADELSRQHALPGEWRLHPEVLQLIWRRFRDAQVDLFASPDTSHCQLFFSLFEGTLGTDALACSWPRGLRKYTFPPVSLLAQTLCKVREDEE